jgi:hypothetical protein
MPAYLNLNNGGFPDDSPVEVRYHSRRWRRLRRPGGR